MIGNGIRILSTGRALPARQITNEEMRAFVDTSDEWVRTRTGIASRYKCEEESCAGLAIEAARRALDHGGIRPDQIGAILCATSTPDYALPSTACLIQQAIPFPEEVIAFDIGAACTGFLFGLGVAQGFLQALNPPGTPEEKERYVLLVGCEELSRILDYTDRSTCILFGDGAGAAIVGPSQARFVQKCWSRGNKEVLVCPGVGQEKQKVTMLGNEVFRFAVGALAQAMDEVLQEAGLTLENVDYVVCHQANERIIRHVQKKYPAYKDKFYMNIDHYGNTSAASIPLAISEMMEDGLLKPGMQILCVGFGAGLTWSGALVQI